MHNIGVLLSGCGFLDGAEIHESVLTLLAIDQHGARAVCCAPDIQQSKVVNHRSKEKENETRNVLDEAARIARGDIRDVKQVKASELDALILPGGFGVALNLCGFAQQGADCAVDPGVEKLVADMLAAKKPIGAICIAPALLARIAGKHGVKTTLTIGNDAGTVKAINAMGCGHENCPVTEIIVDREHRIVSTPAYMLGKGPAEVFEGIRKTIERVLSLI